MRATGKHDAPTTGNLPRILEQVRPDALIAPDRNHLGAIGIDGPEFLRTPERLVGVFPACVDHSPVVQHTRQIIGLVVLRHQIDIVSVPFAARQHKGIGRRHAAHVRVTARCREHDVFVVWQVDRIQVVVRTIGQLPQAAAINSDFVQVERLFVVGLEAEQHLLPVPRHVWAPEGTVQRRLRHELPQMTAGRQAVEHQQARTGHGHIAESVSRLMRPFTAIGKRHVDEQHLLKIQGGIQEHDPPLDFPHLVVDIRIGLRQLRRRLLQRLERRKLCLKLRLVGALSGQSFRQLVSPTDLVQDALASGITIHLMQPITPLCLARFVGRKIAGLRRFGTSIGRNGLRHVRS